MKNTPKNLLIIGSSQGCYGGIEAFMIAVAEVAATWKEFNVKLCFKIVKGYTLSAELQQLASSSCKEVHFINRASKNLIQLVAWADVLHVQNTPPDIIFLGRLMAKKVFLTVHNRRMPGKNLHNLLWGVSIKFVHSRWFNSKFVWRSWEANKQSVKSACIPTVCKLPQQVCPPEERKGFLFVGRWINNKGIEEILKAYALNNFNPQEWPLTVLGSGPLKPAVEELVKNLNLNHVFMPGFVDDASKEKYMSSARWLLAPAKTQEDLGLTPIEARSIGVPSIVTQDGGLPEAGGPAALIAEPGNVQDLAECMRRAAQMDTDEYVRRGELSRTSLAEFLKPMEFYRQAFLN